MTRTVELRANVEGATSASARLGQRPRIEIAFDPTHKRGAIHPADGETMATAARTAIDEGLPLVIRLASSGADIEAGLAAVHGWGVAAREMVRACGVVPIICVVLGPAVSGPALLIGLCDIVIMTIDSYAFVSGPVMVRNFTGQTLGTDELGGAAAHARNTGVVDFIVNDEAEATNSSMNSSNGCPPTPISSQILAPRPIPPIAKPLNFTTFSPTPQPAATTYAR